MELLKGFFVGEYSTDETLTPATRSVRPWCACFFVGFLTLLSSLRDDLWLDYLGLEDLDEYLKSKVPGFSAEWDDISTVGDVLALLPGEAASEEPPVPVPEVTAEQMKLWFPPVIDRFKAERQKSAAAIPLICFYHAGGMVANMRLWSKQLDEVMGPLAVNPMWVELPGRGTRGKEPLLTTCYETAVEVAGVVAGGVLGGDRSRPFAVLGYSVGTLHAYETTRALERMGFVPRALVVLNRNAPQIAMDAPEDNFHDGLDEEAFVRKMSSEYGQKTLLDMWQSHREVVRAALPASRADMQLLTEYRQAADARKLRVPVVAVATRHDRASNAAEAVEAWGAVSEGPLHFRLFDGGHFVFTEQPKVMLPWLGEQLQKLLQ